MPGTNLSLAGQVMVAGALIIFVGAGIYLFRSPPGSEVACTADAMLCPDGSAVGRVPPTCEFAPCPGNPGGGGGILPFNSGITGTVMVGPTCPVETDPPQEECADRPLATLVTVFRESDPVRAVAILESDAEGRFEVSLPPDEYIVSAGESTLPSCPQTLATVESEGYTNIVISCDSGIR